MPIAASADTRERQLMDRAIGGLLAAAPAQRLNAVRHLFVERLN